MELHELEAFAAVATELHFGHAAQKLYIGQPTLSDIVRRLERQLGTPLLRRTTRRVELTEAGTELLLHSKTILNDVAAAVNAVRRIADGDGGSVRVGVTPAVSPVLWPHLLRSFAEVAPGVELVMTQLWWPTLTHALIEGELDVAITCGQLTEHDDLDTELLGCEPLLVGLRPDHRLAGEPSVGLVDLAGDVLGMTPQSLCPAWAAVQEQALLTAHVAPPRAPLTGIDLAATRWTEQPELDWIMLIGSLAGGHTGTAIRPVEPEYHVPFFLQWRPRRPRSPAVARFVHHALTVALPTGWHAPTHRVAR